MIETRVATIAGDAETEPEIAARLSTHPGVRLVLRCVDRVELLGAIRGGDLDTIVSVGIPLWIRVEDVEEAARSGVRLLILTDDPVEADRGRSLGGSLLPGSARIDEIVGRARSDEPISVPTRNPGLQGGPPGRLIAVWGPKGAPGRTSVAIELAHELSEGGESTALVDGDPYGGDILQLLGVNEELPTVVWAARMAAKGELDGAWIARDLRRLGARGPVLIPGLTRPELWPEISAAGWERLIGTVRGLFRHVVCDVGFCLEPEPEGPVTSGRGRNQMTRRSLGDADHAVAVFRADPVGIKNLIVAFESLTELVAADRILLVANRVEPGDETRVGDLLRRHLGKRPIAYLPELNGEFRRAVNTGAPIRRVAAGSDLVSGVRGVASALGGKPRPRGFLTRLGTRSR